MQHILKQSHHKGLKAALKLLCKTLCGPLIKKFGDPWYRG